MTRRTERLESVVSRVRSLVEKSGRDPDETQIVAVTKGFEADVVEMAYRHGLRRFGESRVREALEKKKKLSSEIAEDCEWHFIGHLQSNKVRKILGEFDLIHSVDRESLIDELDKRLSRESMTQEVLMQVNVSREDSKHGARPGDVSEVAKNILSRDSLHLRGLMTIAPWTDDQQVLRQTFSDCVTLREQLEEELEISLPELSMGMTNDYPEAIEQGATLLRLGRALFGERPD